MSQPRKDQPVGEDVCGGGRPSAEAFRSGVPQSGDHGLLRRDFLSRQAGLSGRGATQHGVGVGSARRRPQWFDMDWSLGRFRRHGAGGGRWRPRHAARVGGFSGAAEKHGKFDHFGGEPGCFPYKAGGAACTAKTVEPRGITVGTGGRSGPPSRASVAQVRRPPRLWGAGGQGMEEGGTAHGKLRPHGAGVETDRDRLGVISSGRAVERSSLGRGRDCRGVERA